MRLNYRLCMNRMDHTLARSSQTRAVSEAENRQ
jgi:hypothetical protein